LPFHSWIHGFQIRLIEFPPVLFPDLLRKWNRIVFRLTGTYNPTVANEVVEIPKQVLASIETLDELYDWLTAQNPAIMAELREARQEDIRGKFKAWKPRHASWPTESK
jgi:hypothetical protein